MANIYQISQDLLTIFQELEENGGELTPELEQDLNITQESLYDKIKGYVSVIHHYEDDLDAIKRETTRLSNLKKSKEKIIERLKSVVLKAVEDFGDENKNGVKCIDFGTGKVSTRKSEAVQLYDDNIEHIVNCLNDILDLEADNNQLDVIDSINEDALIDRIASMPIGDTKVGLAVSKDDLAHVSLQLVTGFPLVDVLNGKAWTVLRETIKNNPHFVLQSNVNKTDMKAELKVNRSCAPKIAKLVTNKSLTIK